MTTSPYLSQGLPLTLATLLRRTAPAIVAVATLRLSMGLFDVEMSDPYQALMIIAGLLGLMVLGGRTAPTELAFSGKVLNRTISTLGSWLFMIGILLALGYLTKTSAIYSRLALVTWILITPPIMLAVRLIIDQVILVLSTSSENRRRIVIAGANELGQRLATHINAEPQLGMTLAGFFDDRSSERLGGSESATMLGKLQALPSYVRLHGIEVIFIALPIRNVQRVSELLDELHDTTASIYFAPDVFVFDLIQCRTDEIGGMPVVALCETPFYGTRGLLKRVSDFVLAMVILLAVSPLLVLIAIAVKMSSPGKVFFKQRRYGLDGREISVYKFRSMTVSEDGDTIRQATRDDDRVTPIGRILRRYSLDELPQLINVLQGRMSIVGPRPHAIAHNEEYRRLIKGYMVRHKVNPGITGLAQIRGLRGETETIEQMRERVEADLEYLRNWSLALDLRIILRTALMVLRDKEAY